MPSRLALLLLLLGLIPACGPCSTEQPPPEHADPAEQLAVSEQRDEESRAPLSISEARALEIARQLAADNDIDLSHYPTVSSRLSGESWWVDFTQAAPTPPGGFFGVQVNAQTGEALLHPGE